VWDRVGISAPEPGGRASVVDVHAPLLDSRDWFGPVAAVPAEDVKGAQED